MMRVRSCAPRCGLSLLEVLTALTIFLFSLIVISRLVSLGTDRATDVQYLAQAGMMCQSKMAEVQGGALALSSLGETPYEDETDWYWSMDCVEGTVTGLWNVTIHVFRPQKNGSRIEATLNQMILDPSIRGSTADIAATATTATDTSTTGTGTTGATGTGGSTGATSTTGGR